MPFRNVTSNHGYPTLTSKCSNIYTQHLQTHTSNTNFQLLYLKIPTSNTILQGIQRLETPTSYTPPNTYSYLQDHPPTPPSSTPRNTYLQHLLPTPRNTYLQHLETPTPPTTRNTYLQHLETPTSNTYLQHPNTYDKAAKQISKFDFFFIKSIVFECKYSRTINCNRKRNSIS